MTLSPENLRYILGLKLRTSRQARGLALKEVARRAGLSISYLSEIEKGKKYPKPDKLLALAEALGMSFEELVSPRVGERPGPLEEALGSPFLQEFPFEIFGVEPEDVIALMADDPVRIGALIRTFLEVGRTYDMRVEQFLTAALRSYQEMHANYFEELEREAAAYREAAAWTERVSISPEALGARLESEWGYRLDTETLASHPELSGFRSVFVDGEPPRLLVNRQLLPEQRAFVLAREIGYRRLELAPRSAISTWLEMESFDEVLNNFKASYFAGALLIDRDALTGDLEELFARERWDGASFLRLLRRHHATPEMLLYRLTELVPRRFGLQEIFFLRFTRESRDGGGREDPVTLTKLFNLSRVPVPHGIGGGEHYCRRWPGPRLLKRLATEGGRPSAPRVAVQRSRFLDDDAEFFVIAVARPLVLDRDRLSSVSLGFRVNRAFRRRVRFWNDPSIPVVDVSLTCERCRLTPRECDERVAEPVEVLRRRRLERQKRALAELLGDGPG